MNDAAHSLPDDDRLPERPAPADERPDWLVSSDQGAEDERRAHDDRSGAEELRFSTTSDHSGALSIERPKIPTRPEPGAKPEPEKPTGPKAWAAAASSVPRLKLEPPAAGSSGSAASSSPAAPRGAPATAPPLRAVPARPAPATPAGWDDEPENTEEQGFPDDAGPTGPVAAAPPRKLDEPIWVIALDALRSNPKAQVVTAAAVLLPLLALIFWPRSEPGVSVHSLRQEPTRWDGQVVRINGRVGQVFHVGAGWAYYLHQGRDTIVVFTRGAAPRTRDKISVAGSVSTGYLDGQPRQAIFAEP